MFSFRQVDFRRRMYIFRHQQPLGMQTWVLSFPHRTTSYNDRVEESERRRYDTIESMVPDWPIRCTRRLTPHLARPETRSLVTYHYLNSQWVCS